MLNKIFGSIHLIRTYFTALPRIIFRLSVCLIYNPHETQKFVHQVLSAVDLETDDNILKSVSIEEKIPGGGDIQIVGKYYSQRNGGTQILMELSSLAYLVKQIKPKIIFEIGTFVGRTTRLLASNSSKDCQIITLDLPISVVTHKIGEDYINTPEESRIQQEYGDSRTFDFNPWTEKCDFVWVDANHDYNFVVNDTENALKILRPGGWIGWHDYRHSAWWSGVTRYIRTLKHQYPNIIHIRGTTIVLLQKPLNI